MFLLYWPRLMYFAATMLRLSRFAGAHSHVGEVFASDYPALIDAAKVYAILLSKTQRQAQAELFETKAMVYAAKMKNKSRNDIKPTSP